jgi:translation initiation factor IF-2
MSVRIHELAKKIGISNKELLALLQERNYPVKSHSSTVDTISAEALVEEFANRAKQEKPAEEAVPAQVTPPPQEPKVPAKKTSVMEVQAVDSNLSPAKSASPGPASRPASFVKSAADIARERAEAEAAKRLNPVSPTFLRPSTPASPQPAAPRPAAPAPMAPASLGPAVVRKPAPVAPAINLAPVNLGPVKTPGVRPAPAPAAVTPANPAPAAPTPISPPAAPAPRTPGPPAPVPAAPALAPAPAPVVQGELKILSVKPPIVVKDFATMLGLRSFQLIQELMKMGIFAGLNQAIEENVASQVAERHGFLLEVKHRGESQQQAPKPKKVEVDEAALMKPRPPVVVVMGHVDHGKTSLLDCLRKTNVVAGEAGGITQHMGAYQVERKGQKITFLDTPGHAAFTQMRARGAGVGDIVVLVVAADDGFMPQTDEALKIARQAKAAIIGCINKIDVKGANIDRVKQQFQERNLAPEDWGGETLISLTSAIKGEGVDGLLDNILLQAEMLELKANPTAEASGLVIEAQTQVGIGHTATVIVQRGTLKVGDSLVCGPFHAKVRTMLDERGKPMKEAGPSTPVRVPGWSGVPDVGTSFKAVKNDREARALAEENELELKKQAQENRIDRPSGPTSAAELLQFINQTQKKTFNILLKSDVFGSLEAIENMLGTIKSDKVALDIIGSSVGLISKNDVLLASAGNAEIIGFNVRRENGVDALAKHHGVRITNYEIIYELFDGVKNRMADLLEPEIRESKIGLAQVRAVFPISKGFVAGCLVTEGRVTKDTMARVWRKRQVVHTAKVVTLRRVKDDVNEVKAGTECGIRLDNFNDYQPGDEIECFEVSKVRVNL